VVVNCWWHVGRAMSWFGGCDCGDRSQRRRHGGAGAMVVDGGDGGAELRRARMAHALSAMVALYCRIICVTWNEIAKLIGNSVNYACMQPWNYFL
jgi:hypothetical protein